ncbi:hypothetical protein OROHE_022743 [Orobanche hederae]
MKAVEAICRKFLWSGDVGESKKAPVAWEDVCRPRMEGGLNLVHLPTWNKTSMLKLLWALHKKSDRLWVKWIHAYYIKEAQIMNMEAPCRASFLLKKILKCRSLISGNSEWQELLRDDHFPMKKAYLLIRPAIQKMDWRDLILNSCATPRAKFILWLALHRRLATKDRLQVFGVNIDETCVFCHQDRETIDHLLFNCSITKSVWSQLLCWLGIPRQTGCWDQEVRVLSRATKGKSAMARVLKVMIAETVYAVWRERNRHIFQGDQVNVQRVVRQVVYVTSCRCLCNPKLAKFCESLKLM